MSSKDPKKSAPAKPVAKSVTPAKGASKPSAKAAPIKATPAKAAPVKATPAKVAPAKVAAKPVAKAAPAKPVAKPAAKPAPKATAPVAKAPIATKPAQVVTKAPTAATVKTPVAKTSPAKVAPAAIDEEEVVDTKAKDLKEGKVQEVSILLRSYKLQRSSFFFEVLEADERINKKKYTGDVKVPEKPTICVRNRSSLVEETPEELIERLAQELEEEHFGMLREFGSQMCTKCGRNPVSIEYRVDKDLGYCEDCADILRLGQSKEARKSDYQMSLMRKDPLASEDEEEAEGDGVDDEELEELEED